MQRLPIDIGIIHFIGIGGIGMSGIAEILHNLGYKVQGSDISENQNVKRLQAIGVKVFVGQVSKNLNDAQERMAKAVSTAAADYIRQLKKCKLFSKFVLKHKKSIYQF